MRCVVAPIKSSSKLKRSKESVEADETSSDDGEVLSERMTKMMHKRARKQ